jgi:hypothetical protein
MTLTSTIIIAITSRIWIRPPMVYEVTIPNNHSTNRITQIVHSITSTSIIDWLHVASAYAVSLPVIQPYRIDHDPPERVMISSTA